MRLITFQTPDGPTAGIVRGEEVTALPGANLLALIEQGEAGRDRAERAVGPRYRLPELQLLAPIPTPRRNIICVGLNYLEHAREGFAARGKEVRLPERPLFFTKATTAVNGPYGDIPLDPAVTAQLDWEAELGVVIGRGGKNIPRDQAMAYVFGYTVINDVSARDVQTGHGGQFFKGKSLDGCCPMGPWIVTADEVPDPRRLRVCSRVNGVVKQDASTAEFIFDIPTLLEWLSKGMTLLPGDILATGTPAGVGFARTPPEFLQPGDVVECEIEGLGLIRNRIVSAS
jgi:2-keto-4-pentenoate hydratase/2-oxohepta-3-ene-1,7-dioic acid hydratase in catechol pathway